MELYNLYSSMINRTAYEYLHFYYHFYKNRLKKEINDIMQYSESDLGLNPSDQEERALPGFSKYTKTGYCKYMLSRYLYTIKYIKNKVVLDSGCGLGWGSYLISRYPKEIISIDIDRDALDFAQMHWKENKIIFKNQSILELDLLHKKFDVVFGFELIEHLTINQAITYLSQVFGSLKKNGVLIMSSYFPESEESARESESKNIFHLHIFTKQEIRRISKNIGFSRFHFLGDFMVVIKK